MSDVNPARSFLIATWEGGGSVPPMLDLARKLVQRGHRVRVMSDACNRPEAEASGATFVPWTRAPSKPGRAREFDTFNDWDAPTPDQGFRNLMRAVLAGPALNFAMDVMAELAREPVDLVVSSEMLFGVHVGCEAAGQPFVLLGVNIPLFPVPGIPPLGPGLPPARTADEQALHAEITAQTVAMLDAELPSLNAARAALGLPELAHLLDQHRLARAMLHATSPAFDFAPVCLPPGQAYVGPLLGEPAWAEPWTSPFAEDRGRPLALVAFSTTYQGHVEVLQQVIDALETLPVDAVVTLGHTIHREELRAPENVALVTSAPHHAVLRQARVVVTHGGHGTVMKALSHGRPLLLVPHGRDQEDNAIRVTARRAGLTVPRTSDAAEYRTAIQRLLEEPAFTDCARALGGRIVKDAAESPLLSMLEDFASPGGQIAVLQVPSGSGARGAERRCVGANLMEMAHVR